jgi:TatD DNase family protein
VPHRGKANEPAHVALVGAAVAEAMGRRVDEVAEATTANARVFYALAGHDQT